MNVLKSNNVIIDNQQPKQKGKNIMKIEEAQKKINNRFPEENLTIIQFEGKYKKSCTIVCNDCGWQRSYTSFSHAVSKSKKCFCQNCVRHKKIQERFIQSIQDRIPNEPFILHNFTTTQNECDVECSQCHNIVHYTSASTLLGKKHICNKCHPLRYDELQNRIMEFKKFIEESSNWELITDVDTITSSRELIECKCLLCDTINLKTMYDYLKGIGCLCSRRGDIQEQIKKACGDDYKIIDIAKTTRQRVTLQHCCGFIYSTNSRNFVQGYGQCPKCCKRNSRGEKRIRKFLDNHNIDYEREFPVKIQNHLLRFDFYLPQYDLYIEYNGEQHYKEIDFWGGQQGFKKRTEYDKLKRDYCKTKLLEIKYTNYDHIEEILSARFNDYPEKE